MSSTCRGRSAVTPTSKKIEKKDGYCRLQRSFLLLFIEKSTRNDTFLALHQRPNEYTPKNSVVSTTSKGTQGKKSVFVIRRDPDSIRNIASLRWYFGLDRAVRWFTKVYRRSSTGRELKILAVTRSSVTPELTSWFFFLRSYMRFSLSAIVSSLSRISFLCPCHDTGRQQRKHVFV